MDKGLSHLKSDITPSSDDHIPYALEADCFGDSVGIEDGTKIEDIREIHAFNLGPNRIGACGNDQPIKVIREGLS
jgi:hypothetical protein